ncbi:ABC transporter ATP-binding protein [uncultured Desulfuromonas sp.]|uniref:ABC transporter ATP-binding protein n=1 Tax=uncultured Desulfuromonas sp. TaxID=181013 RepID=UPI002AAB0B8F|nr:ABC transporter ATP-binding protein [uncultured Desulfuromonas sp.]
MMQYASAIHIDQLSKTYRTLKKGRVDALKNLSLSVMPGESFGFLGPNGAGKSTTIRLLLGLMRATSGSAFLFGQPVTSQSAREKVGYLPENPSFPDQASVVDVLTLVGRMHGMDNSRLQNRIATVLEQVNLAHALKQPIRSYSKGMVQRLGIAQAVVHDPDLLILDEPMSGLDPIGRALVKDLIKEWKRQGKTIFFSSHIISDVETACDRVGIIVKGQLREVQDISTVLTGGVSGYRLLLSDNIDGFDTVFSGSYYEFQCEKKALGKTLAALEQQNTLPVLVEPIRCDLEHYFLDVVGIAKES